MPSPKPLAPRKRRFPSDRNGQMTEVVNKPVDEAGKPLHHYVLVPKNQELHGVNYYKMLGYEVTPLSEGGARLRGIPRDAEPAPHQEWMGCILMQLPMDEYDELILHGADGAGGTAAAEELSRQMSRKANPMARDGVIEVNETEPQRWVSEA